MQEVKTKLEKAISAAQEWFKNNSLQINPSKTEIILVENRNRRNLENITIEENDKTTNISPVNQVKILGVIIDQNLTWSQQIKQVKGRAANIVRHLARTSRVLPQRSQRMLYDALVCPHLSYADVVWDGCRKQDQEQLQRVHNFAAKVIAGADKRASTTKTLKTLGMVPLSEKRKMAVFVHKLVNGHGPAELCERLQQIRGDQQLSTSDGLRSRKSLYIRPVQHKTAKYEKSTLWRASKAWNQTRPEHRLTDDTAKFKTDIQREMTRAYHGCY